MNLSGIESVDIPVALNNPNVRIVSVVSQESDQPLMSGHTLTKTEIMRNDLDRLKRTGTEGDVVIEEEDESRTQFLMNQNLFNAQT